MGIGLYNLLGWGVLNPPVLTSTDEDGTVWIDDALEDAVEHLGLHSAYETRPPYLVIPLAVSDEVLQELWTLAALPDWCPRAKARRARVIDAPLSDVQNLVDQYGGNMEQVWEDAQHIYMELGLALPKATLIIASDWD
jgi:hypothetical protein